jgi:hypothetical protein
MIKTAKFQQFDQYHVVQPYQPNNTVPIFYNTHSAPLASHQVFSPSYMLLLNNSEKEKEEKIMPNFS